MATDPNHGLGGALGLDDAARDLGADGEEPIQREMFAGSSVFGRLVTIEGAFRPSGPGRPKGSRNRSTADLAKLIQATGRHPLLAMAEIVATPIDVIAATLGCKLIEAAEYHRKVMADLAPYVAQKMPTAVQVEGATAGMLTVVQIGQAIGGDGRSEVGLSMRLIEGNQGLSQDDTGEPHDDAPHDDAKSLTGNGF